MVLPLRVNFNSIKVQLEHIAVGLASGLVLFQFHKGTIRTGIRLLWLQATMQFQFHKGTIRTYSSILHVCI